MLKAILQSGKLNVEATKLISKFIQTEFPMKRNPRKLQQKKKFPLIKLSKPTDEIMPWFSGDVCLEPFKKMSKNVTFDPFLLRQHPEEKKKHPERPPDHGSDFLYLNQ